MRTHLFILAFASLLAAACAGEAASVPANHPVVPTTVPTAPAAPPAAVAPTHAAADLLPRSGSAIKGHADFEVVAGGTQVTIKIEGAKPGKHGVHLHETGDCSAPDAKSAGGHFNPAGVAHGAPGAAPHHGGDLGNIDVGAGGTGSLTLVVPDLVMGGPFSIIGRSVVVHDGEDDLHSQPAGNSGARDACGVVEAK